MQFVQFGAGSVKTYIKAMELKQKWQETQREERKNAARQNAVERDRRESPNASTMIEPGTGAGRKPSGGKLEHLEEKRPGVEAKSDEVRLERPVDEPLPALEEAVIYGADAKRRSDDNLRGLNLLGTAETWNKVPDGCGEATGEEPGGGETQHRTFQSRA